MVTIGERMEERVNITFKIPTYFIDGASSDFAIPIEFQYFHLF